jgi:hypothetical protein
MEKNQTEKEILFSINVTETDPNQSPKEYKQQRQKINKLTPFRTSFEKMVFVITNYGGVFSPYIFKYNRRSKEHSNQKLSVMVLDYDKGIDDKETLYKYVKDNIRKIQTDTSINPTIVIIPSISYTKEKPKYRIFIPIQQTEVSKETLTQIIDTIDPNQMFDKSSFIDTSRMYYFRPLSEIDPSFEVKLPKEINFIKIKTKETYKPKLKKRNTPSVNTLSITPNDVLNTPIDQILNTDNPTEHQKRLIQSVKKTIEDIRHLSDDIQSPPFEGKLRHKTTYILCQRLKFLSVVNLSETQSYDIYKEITKRFPKYNSYYTFKQKYDKE